MRHAQSASAGPADESLMRQVARGNPDALGELFARHHQRVHALCFRFVGEPATADDLVQESFLRVQRYGTSFDGRARFTTWLYRLVRNVCMDHLAASERDAQRHKQAAAHLELMSEPSELPEERLELVRRALYRMPPDKREVLVLSRYQGLKYAEIAELLDVTVEAVKARAHRAMRDLRRIFHELEQEA